MNPGYLIALRDHPARDELCKYLRDKLQAHSFHTIVPERTPGIIIAQANPQDLEAHAEHLKIRKLVKATGELQAFDVATRKSFANIDTPDLWLPFEDAYLTRGLLKFVRTDEDFQQVLSKVNNSLKTTAWRDQPLLEVCDRLKLLQHVGPLHNIDKVPKVWDKNKKRVLSMDLEPIRNYFGEHVAFYFAWMNFMDLWLLLPAALSLAMWVWPTTDEASGLVTSRTYIPVYSAFMVIWGILGAKFWRRTTNRLAWEWDTAARARSEDVRPAFKGIFRTSPVTGESELYFKPLFRLPLYFITTTITAALVSTALFLIIAMLNLQAVVLPDDVYFYMPFVGGWAQPGQLFDPDGKFTIIVLVISKVLPMIFKKMVYIPAVKFLTNLENHRTAKAHTNSMILKRYLYEAADRFVPLLYISMFKTDAATIQKEFQMLYLTDTLRRLVTETLLPTFKVRSKSPDHQLLSSKSRRGDALLQDPGLQAKKELTLKHYDEFDDFLEMVVEFGYITMFAAAYPPAAFISLLVNMLEERSDLFKLTNVYRRPQVVRASSIGTWQWLIEAQVWVSVMTNLFVVVFTGSHLAHWLPFWFSHDEDESQQGSLDSNRLVVILVVEHILLLIMLVITMGIPDEPEKVRAERRRLEYVREQSFLRTQQQQRRGLLNAMSMERKAAEGLLDRATTPAALADKDNNKLS